MGAVFSGPPKPKKPTPPPTEEDPAVEEARRKEQLAAQQARGRAATLVTGTQGDTTDPNLGKKTLLGQ